MSTKNWPQYVVLLKKIEFLSSKGSFKPFIVLRFKDNELSCRRWWVRSMWCHTGPILTREREEHRASARGPSKKKTFWILCYSAWSTYGHSGPLFRAGALFRAGHRLFALKVSFNRTTAFSRESIMHWSIEDERDAWGKGEWRLAMWI